jgi:hypothetical protein
VPRGAPLKSMKQAMKVLRRAWLFDRLGWWLNRQPLFCGQSDRLGGQSNC